jgi:predicted DNA-binding transcriptional regulator AlpA
VEKLLRLPAVLELIPVGKTTWYKWISEGRAPQPRRLGTRMVAWPEGEVRGLIKKLRGDEDDS